VRKQALQGRGASCTRAHKHTHKQTQTQTQTYIHTQTYTHTHTQNARLGTGGAVDAFAGRAGSALVLERCELHRFAALPPDDAAALATSLARPPRFPGRQVVRVLSPGGCGPGGQADMEWEDFAAHWGAARADTRDLGTPGYGGARRGGAGARPRLLGGRAVRAGLR
jgi:hypothetical protein